MDKNALVSRVDLAGWGRAAAFAAAAPDAREASMGVLAEAVPATGAAAGMVLLPRAAEPHTVWGCTPEEARALARHGGPVAKACVRDGGWPRQTMVIPSSLLRVSPECQRWSGLVALPLDVRGATFGLLLLAFDAPGSPHPRQVEAAAGFASLLGLTLEGEQLVEEARQARQTRDHFLIAINHELRTPATALMLDAGLIQTGLLGALPPRLQKTLTQVEAHVRDLVNVVGNVLNLAQLEAGQSPARAQVVEPRDLITESLRRFEPAANRKRIELSLFLPRALPPIQTDAERFERVLLHLLSNAIKYTEGGRIEVRVERHVLPGPTRRREPHLVVRIRDTGRGIPPEELERIFEPFAQVEEGVRTDSRTRGLGLGLPLARKQARSLGGDVRVESAEGEGTVATLLLPYRQDSVG